MKTFHEDRCQSKIRKTFTDKITNKTVILSGKHAFDWQVTIVHKTTVVYSFDSRIKAVKEYEKIVKAYKL